MREENHNKIFKMGEKWEKFIDKYMEKEGILPSTEPCKNPTHHQCRDVHPFEDSVDCLPWISVQRRMPPGSIDHDGWSPPQEAERVIFYIPYKQTVCVGVYQLMVHEDRQTRIWWVQEFAGVNPRLTTIHAPSSCQLPSHWMPLPKDPADCYKKTGRGR